MLISRYQKILQRGNMKPTIRNIIPRYNYNMQKSHQYGFIIDIDGTLTHGSTPIPGASKTLEHFKEKNTPFLLLTNNCAPSEQWKAQRVSKDLGLSFPLTEKQIVLNYSPVLHRFKDVQGIVLVVGREERLEEIMPLPDMEKYLTSYEYCSLFPEAFPLASKYNVPEKVEATHAKVRQRLNMPKIDKFNLKISGVLILTTPTCWQESIQIILDILSTPNGHLTPNHSYQHQKTTSQQWHAIATCSASQKTTPLPRILMKPYLQSLKTVYKLIYNADLKIDIYGKPHPSAFNYAKEQLEQIYGPVSKIVMIGDNIQSDIIGPVELGWDTILVKSGVSKEDHHLATINAEHIQEGVEKYMQGELEKKEA